MRKWHQNLRIGAFVATVAFMLVGFSGMFGRLRYIFADELEDMSHGWLVPIFSLYVLWTQRAEIKKDLGAPSFWGGLACLPCVAIALLGTRGLQVRFEQLGFIGLCIALPWAFFGRAVARRCVFPALFLFFTMPMTTYLDFVTIHLRLIATNVAYFVLRGFGVDVVREGTVLASGGSNPFSIGVAEACSGMRSIVALMALTMAYAWYTQPTWKRRIALFACSIPLAVLGNVVRILSICLVAVWADPKFATGFYHDYSGYIVFVVAIACVVGCGELISRWSDRRRRRGASEGRAGAQPSRDDAAGQEPVQVPSQPLVGKAEPSRVSIVFLLGLCVALSGIFCFQAATPKTVLVDPPVVEWPDFPGYRTDGIVYCQNEKCARTYFESEIDAGVTNCPVCAACLDCKSLGENTILPSDTKILKRVYRSATGWQFVVSAVIGGAEKSSIHRPELCLPTQGVQMSDPCNFTVEGRPFHAIQLNRAYMRPTLLAYTFFNQEGVHTSSHLKRIFIDTWDRSFHNRIDRWVMITVNVSAPWGISMDASDDRKVVEGFLGLIGKELP